jgi:L-alanine-DL-glutamate epimerase-like enolase superfamily enzyme
MAYLSRELSMHGYHAQVVTATGEAALDRQILCAVREAVGDGVQLRVDAQACYTLDAARDLCREIEGQQIQCLIDPLATHELYPIAALARQTTVPLGLWRAVRSPGDLMALARCDAAAHVVVDPEQLGGIAPARACAAIGAAAGISLMLGSRPSLGIAAAAMLHLAAATPGLTAANESAYHQLANDVLADPLELSGGMMTVPDGPGLGVEVDRGKVDRFLVD